MKIKIITTGGTIDKIYFDRKSAFEVGEPQIGELLQEANVTVPYEIKSLLKKDSMDLRKKDRKLIYQEVENDSCKHFVITHGTDTIIQTAKYLKSLKDKVIVLTGSLAPAKFRESDAIFNIGCAVVAVQTLPFGVYIAMNGQIFDPDQVQKSSEFNRFELILSEP